MATEFNATFKDNAHFTAKFDGVVSIGAGTRYVVGEEVKIGTWTEGGVVYDLFRKVIDCGELPNAASKTVVHGIADRDKWTRITGVALHASGSKNFPLPFAATDTPEKNIYISVGNKSITIVSGTDRSDLRGYVTLEYTRARSES